MRNSTKSRLLPISEVDEIVMHSSLSSKEIGGYYSEVRDFLSDAFCDDDPKFDLSQFASDLFSLMPFDEHHPDFNRIYNLCIELKAMQIVRKRYFLKD